MAKKKDTSIDDLADAINALATTMEKRFDEVDKRFDGVDKRFDQQDTEIKEIKNQLFTMTREQRETREAIVRLESNYGGLNADIAEVYDRIVAIENLLPKETDDREIQAIHNSISILSAWARETSKQTGVAQPKL